MYFGAIANLNLEESFNGLILFRPLVKISRAKRNSSKRPAGILIKESVSMNRNLFNEVIIEVISAVVIKLPSAKRIRIIADGAGLQSVGKGLNNALNNSLKKQDNG